jgi:hypothetical protein
LKLDPIDAERRIRGRHWKTHWRVLLAAERAIGIIVDRSEQIVAHLRSVEEATPAVDADRTTAEL